MSKAARRKDPQGKGKIQEWRGEEGCRRRGSSGSHTERPKFSSCSGEQGGRRKGSSAASHKRQGLKSRGVKKAAGGGKLQAALAYDITCKSSGSEQGGRWRRTLIRISRTRLQEWWSEEGCRRRGSFRWHYRTAQGTGVVAMGERDRQVPLQPPRYLKAALVFPKSSINISPGPRPSRNSAINSFHAALNTSHSRPLSGSA